jgi:predicted membrane channel-forming protein YqfA (hemolysin III family)
MFQILLELLRNYMLKNYNQQNTELMFTDLELYNNLSDNFLAKLGMLSMLLMLAIGIGLIVWQIFLAKKENKWIGLILPIITACDSLIFTFYLYTLYEHVYFTNTFLSIVLLFIYIFFRERNKQHALDKMSVQDLE